jgi:hypothetical protein
MKLLKYFFGMFKSKSAVELYIESKNPQSAGDVDYWTTRYYRERSHV